MLLVVVAIFVYFRRRFGRIMAFGYLVSSRMSDVWSKVRKSGDAKEDYVCCLKTRADAISRISA